MKKSKNTKNPKLQKQMMIRRNKQKQKAKIDAARKKYVEEVSQGIPENTTMIPEVTVTAKPLIGFKNQIPTAEKAKSFGEIATNIADDASSSVRVSDITRAIRTSPAFNLMKSAAQSPRMKAIGRIFKRTANIGSRIVAPPMLINPLQGDIHNLDRGPLS